jgi:hypothetical protein
MATENSSSMYTPPKLKLTPKQVNEQTDADKKKNEKADLVSTLISKLNG